MDTLLKDLRYAIRLLRKNLAYTLIAVVALGLGVGATTTVFSVVYSALLRPWIYPDLEHVVLVWNPLVKYIASRSSMSVPDFLEYERENIVFSDIAALRDWQANLTGAGETDRMQGLRVTPGYFKVLGVRPEQGRFLVPADTEHGGANVLVISHGFWQRRLASDPSVIGRQLTLDGKSYTIVGVMPFEFDLGRDAWLPLTFTSEELADRNSRPIDVIARLRPEISITRAEAELRAIAARLERTYPDNDTGRTIRLALLREDRTFGTRQFVLTLMGASIFVLLLGCANVANLRLAQGMARRKEMAIRAALGAGRGRLISQVLTESIVVSLLGSVLGVALAYWGITFTRGRIPATILMQVAGLQHIGLNMPVLGFAIAAAVAAGVLSGIFAALHASRADVNENLKEGGRDYTGGKNRLRAAFATCEIAFALVLLAGAGLMSRGFRNLMVLNQGFETKGVLSLRVRLPRARYEDARLRSAYFHDAVKTLETIPGVEAAAAVSNVPASWSWRSDNFRIEGRPELRPGERMTSEVQSVTPGFFSAMRIPLVAGRWFSEQDGSDATPVAVINQQLARRYWKNEAEAIGARVRVGLSPNGRWHRIAGVVSDVKQSPFEAAYPSIYLPESQVPDYAAGLVIRTSGDPLAAAPLAQERLRQIDREAALFDVYTVESMLNDNISGVRISAVMMRAFALIALILAAAGIYAIMAYMVVQRTHEIGVRMAVGASRGDILKLIVSHAARLTLVGLGIGLALALPMSRALSSLLFGVLNIDPLTLAGLSLLLCLVALLAGYVPAYRAARLDPLVALRNQ